MSYAGMEAECEHGDGADCLQCIIARQEARGVRDGQGVLHADNGSGWCVGHDGLICTVKVRHCEVLNTPEELEVNRRQDLKEDRLKAQRALARAREEFRQAELDLRAAIKRDHAMSDHDTPEVRLTEALAAWDFGHSKKHEKIWAQGGKWCHQCQCGLTFAKMADWETHRYAEGETILAARLAEVQAERDHWKLTAERFIEQDRRHNDLRSAAEQQLADLRAKVAGLADEWRKPLAGALQRANTGDDFHDIYTKQDLRKKHATALRVLLDGSTDAPDTTGGDGS